MSAPDLSVSALRTVAAFLPIMTDPSFRFTDGNSPLHQGLQGHLSVVGYTYDPQVNRLRDTLYDLQWVQVFPWLEWAKTSEAQALQTDPDALAQAAAEQLAHLMTVFVRQERLSDGAMLEFWESGLLLRILRRVKVLAYEEQQDVG